MIDGKANHTGRHAIRARLETGHRYKWVVFFTALAGLISANFMVSVLAAAVGELSDEFGVDQSLMRWVVTGPNLGFAVLAVTAGKLADLYGRRQAFLVALVGSGFFGALSAAAWSAESLIVFRTISAIFGSAAGPAGIAIIATQFSSERRIQVMGWWGLVMAGGPVAGIIIGGPVIDFWSWRWLFIAQIPLTLTALLGAWLVLPETTRRPDVRFDIPGTVLLASAASVFLWAVNRGPLWGWGSPSIALMFLAAGVLLMAFLRQEMRTPAPLIPIEYFKSRNFTLPMLSQFFTNFSYMGAGFVLAPLFLSEVFGYSVTKSSYLISSRPLFFALAGPVVGMIGIRLGERVLAVTGAALVMSSALSLAFVDAETSDLFIFAALGVAGFGLGSSMPAMTSAITHAVAEDDIATAGGAQQMMWQLGTAAGIEVLGSVQESREKVTELADSFAQAFLVAAGFAAVGMVLAMGVTRLARTD
ncbi:MAG: EmrB/QacA subfamily drug resistance transporter [Candidatus Poriferisodalaceae bacterium]|jgi:EmrB/QacA subfamily drug resistance transporter